MEMESKSEENGIISDSSDLNSVEPLSLKNSDFQFSPRWEMVDSDSNSDSISDSNVSANQPYVGEVWVSLERAGSSI